MGIRLASETLKRAQNQILEITSRTKPESMTDRIRKLNSYLSGWLGYYALAETPSKFELLEGWIRRRLRMCVWKQWNRVRTRYRELRALGIPEWAVHKLANARKGHRRVSQMLSIALDNRYWSTQGLMSLTERYHQIRQAWQTAVYRTVRTVV